VNVVHDSKLKEPELLSYYFLSMHISITPVPVLRTNSHIASIAVPSSCVATREHRATPDVRILIKITNLFIVIYIKLIKKERGFPLFH
jgi:hypothetical protein